MRERKSITRATKDKVKDKFKNKCSVCGISGDNTKLNISHIMPYAYGGDSNEDNLLLICPNCHANMDLGPREIEYVQFLNEILSNSGLFDEIKTEALVGNGTRARIDLLAKVNNGSMSEAIIIECKSYRAISKRMSSQVVEKLTYYQKEYGNSRLVFSLPARLPDFIKNELVNHGIEVWDIDFLVSKYLKEIKFSRDSYFKKLFLAVAVQSDHPRELELLDRLKSYKPGRKDCYLYQSLVGDILEHIFSPPLNKPLPELSDKIKANRRDFIMPNYSSEGFWYYIREKYSADYIVVDAKNYSRKVKKNDVLQIANYLKPHGVGKFGLIFSRNGGDATGCEHTLREQWMVHEKMIIVLDDNDVEAMLKTVSAGGRADEIISRKIEEFRLSM